MSDYLFYQVAQNHLLRLEGPLGTFSYREDDSENVVLLATGSGIAPIKSMLEHFSEFRVKKIFTLFGE